jgi:hypothetical protein
MNGKHDLLAGRLRATGFAREQPRRPPHHKELPYRPQALVGQRILPPMQAAAVLASSIMRNTGLMGSIGAVRRKLRAVTAVVADSGATEPEKANAETLKARLEQRLSEAGAPAGDWTDNLFRLGRRAKEISESVSPELPKGDWTDHAHRLGKGVRRGYKKWLSQ